MSELFSNKLPVELGLKRKEEEEKRGEEKIH
jgi:hypothetical protein